jgi:FkbM family methyltransferase
MNLNALKSGILRAAEFFLPTKIKNAIVHVGFNIGRPEFDRFAQTHSYAPDMGHGLKHLRSRGFAPSIMIDVGAFHGDWSRLAHSIWPHASVVMIEPNAQNNDALYQTMVETGAALVSCLLGAETGKEVEFHVMASGSSIFEEHSPVARSSETRTLTTLDAALVDIEVTGPALLKIDAQGYELEILKGAISTIEKCAAILLEVAIIEVNKGAPLLHEVLPFMRGLGFVTFDILEIHRRPLNLDLNQIDLLFVRADSPLVQDKRHYA